jgi:hypothetical protein
VPGEVRQLLEASGFGEFTITTRDYGIAPPYPPIPGFADADRGETIFCQARKISLPMKRAVTPLYLSEADFTGFF